ncbi:MAG: hypothetical protein AAGL24_10430 [Pseudomonadota bacterium]
MKTPQSTRLEKFGASLLAAFILLAGTAVGHAQTESGATSPDDERYTVRKLDNGYLRLDKQTGDMSHCVKDHHEAWTCVILPETRTRYEARIEALKTENSYMKARQDAMAAHLLELEETLESLRERLAAYEGDGDRPTGEKPFISTDDRKRLNEALDVAESMMQRFSRMMRGLKEDAEKLTSKVPGIGDSEPEDQSSESQ